MRSWSFSTFSSYIVLLAKNSEKNPAKRRRKNAKKYCVQSGDNIYPEDGRFAIADSNVTYRLPQNATAQATILWRKFWKGSKNKNEWWIFKKRKQIEINIDYILILVTKYHDSHCNDKETLITIQKSIDASPELRSKKALIENFIDGINVVDDVMAEWHSYIAAEKEKQLNEIIAEEKLKADETKKFVDNAIADGEMRTTGTDIDKLMSPISRFGNTNREKKKQTIIEKLKAFFERFFGVWAEGKMIRPINIYALSRIRDARIFCSERGL